jgi:hypothetical protein
MVMPVMRIDVEDDGSPEVAEWLPETSVETFATVGPNPLVIRLSLGASVTGAGQIASSLHVNARRGDTPVNVLQSGCGLQYAVVPRFDGNLGVFVPNSIAGSSVAVFGLTTAPLLLGILSGGPSSPSLPCLLLPRPDLVLFLPTTAATVLVVPPAARPISLYSQLVRFGGPVLTTSDAFQIIAF